MDTRKGSEVDEFETHASVLDPQASESVSRFLAYLSPYLFWGTVSLLGVGLLLA